MTTKEKVAIVAIGDVGVGKSTTLGHLYYRNELIEARIIRKFEAEGHEIGRSSYKYAWVFDSLRAERERGMTIDAKLKKIETSTKIFTIIDAPGHKYYVKNMISATHQADVALLFVSAANGEFEAGNSLFGATKTHAQLAYALGIKQIIVAVNKMDEGSVKYSQARFEEIQAIMSRLLRKAGFPPRRISYIPISGWWGQNLTDKTSDLFWYQGPTLMEALDATVVPVRPVDRPLRMPIRNVFNIGGVGTVVVGRIATGVLKREMIVGFTSSNYNADVKSIEMHHNQLEEAHPGDCVGFHVNLYDQVLRPGFVVYDPSDDPAVTCEIFEAQVVVINHPTSIKNGYTAVVDVHTAHVPCKWSICSKLDRHTGVKLEGNTTSMKNGESGLVNFYPTKPLCVEPFALYAALGRFAVRDMGQLVAIGVVKTTNKKSVPRTKGAISS